MSNGLDSLHDDDDYKLEDLSAEEQAAKEEEENNKNKDEDKLSPGRTPKADDDEEEDKGEGGGEETEEEKAAREAEEAKGSDEPGLSGIEAYLSQYNIKGGMITTLDEEGKQVQKHFDELTSSEQESVLNKLATDHRPSVEENLGLVEEEVQLLNTFRESKKPVEEFINELAQKKAEEIIQFQNSGGKDFKTMPNDEIMTINLKNQYPDASDEEIATELSSQKESKFYEGNVNTIREKFVQDQNILETEARDKTNKEILEQQDRDRVTIATAVDGIDSVAGWDIDNDDKNAVLADLLEVNEHGDSKFMEKIYSSPEELFKAAWLYTNGESRIDSLEKYWKKQRSLAYQEGKNFAANGMPSDPISSDGTGITGKEGKSQDDPNIRKERGTTLSELHDED